MLFSLSRCQQRPDLNPRTQDNESIVLPLSWSTHFLDLNSLSQSNFKSVYYMAPAYCKIRKFYNYLFSLQLGQTRITTYFTPVSKFLFIKILIPLQSGCPWQAFPAKSIVCGQVQEPRVEHLKGSSIGVGSCITNKQQTKLERLPRDKHSSLLRKFQNFGRKSFITLGPVGVEKHEARVKS